MKLCMGKSVDPQFVGMKWVGKRIIESELGRLAVETYAWRGKDSTLSCTTT